MAAASKVATSQWDAWADAALRRLASKHVLRRERPIALPPPPPQLNTFAAHGPWDRQAVEIDVAMDDWLEDHDAALPEKKQLLLFSGNDYLGLASHPAVREAAVKAAAEHGMGPRGSSMICGYTSYHKLLEESLASSKKQQDCILCPTGFAANMAFMSALGSISSLLAGRSKPPPEERIAVFSDALNHASIIDGIRLVERAQEVAVIVYRHCDMAHLDNLLQAVQHGRRLRTTAGTGCAEEQARLHCLQAHGSLVCGENGGGAAEMFGCDGEVDICIGTLSKAAGSLGGYIACSNTWKQLVECRGRSFIFSTSLPVPIVAAAHGMYASVEPAQGVSDADADSGD